MKIPAFTASRVSRSEAESSNKRILALLQTSPLTADELSRATGCSVSFVQNSLTKLRNEGSIVRKGTPGRTGGNEYVYTANPRAKQFESGSAVRDPLVAALFGNAGSQP